MNARARSHNRASKRGGASSARRRAKRDLPWAWIAVGAFVAVAAVVAIVVSVSSGSSSDEAIPAGVEQTRPVSVAGAALPQPAKGGTDPAVGQAIPEVRGQSFDGTPVAITNDGKAKLVVIGAHWCPHCQREMPILSDYLESHSLPAGLELVTVATGTNADAPNYPPSSWLQGLNWPGPVLADDMSGSAAGAFGLPAYPYFVAVGPDGKVVARTSGEITTDQFARLAQQAVAGAGGP